MVITCFIVITPHRHLWVNCIMGKMQTHKKVHVLHTILVAVWRAHGKILTAILTRPVKTVWIHYRVPAKSTNRHNNTVPSLILPPKLAIWETNHMVALAIVCCIILAFFQHHRINMLLNKPMVMTKSVSIMFMFMLSVVVPIDPSLITTIFWFPIDTMSKMTTMVTTHVEWML